MDDEQEEVDQAKEAVKEVVEENLLSQPKYEVRPDLDERFQVSKVKDIIDQTMQENLLGRTYSSSQAEKWTRAIAKTVRERVNNLFTNKEKDKNIDMKRYKVMVQVTLGEMKGAGIKSCMRCLWDSECDNYATHIFRSDTMFCSTTVFGVYFY